MTRPSEITRERVLKAAERLFAERGYDSTSVRAIVAKARVNQAAINYHFAGKEGLYREVLRTAFRGLTEHQLSHAEEAKAMSPEQALGEFVRRQLQPITARDEVSRYMRIFNWETARPTQRVSQTDARRGGYPSWGWRSIWCADLCRSRSTHARARCDLADRAVQRVRCAIASSWPAAGRGFAFDK